MMTASDCIETESEEVTQSHENLIEDDVTEKWADCKSQLWVTVLAIGGALVYTIHAYSIMTEEIRIKTGKDVITGVAAVVWTNPVIGTIQTIITAVKSTQGRREENLSLDVAFRVIVLLQQILFVGSVGGILWVTLISDIPMAAGTKVLQYIFLFCPYILSFRNLFHFHCHHQSTQGISNGVSPQVALPLDDESLDDPLADPELLIASSIQNVELDLQA